MTVTDATPEGVGDPILDLLNGFIVQLRAAGLPVVACRFGFLSQPVETLGADAIIDGYDTLIPTLERLGPSAT